MPNWAKVVSAGLIFSLVLWPLLRSPEPFTADIQQARVIEANDSFYIQTKIDYRLSPTAKEALHKGIPLTWTTLIEIRKIGQLWDSTLAEQALPFQLRFHALLNQYEVLAPDAESEMFLTLNAAMGFISGTHSSQPVAADLLQPGQHYKLAVKCRFERELLPVPLRPFSYLEPDWFLSSDWYLWPFQK